MDILWMHLVELCWDVVTVDNRPKSYAKLDAYDYKFRRVDGLIYAIIIYVDSVNAVDVADIASESNANGGNLYVEGHYFQLLAMKTVKDEHKPYMLLTVVEK